MTKGRLKLWAWFSLGVTLSLLVAAGAFAFKNCYWHGFWPDWWNAVLGLFVTVIDGWLLVRPLLDLIEDEIRGVAIITPFDPTDTDSVRKWEALTRRGGGGRWIGFFERMLFFASAYMGAWVIAGGWLAFKLASKWESWKVVGETAGSGLGRSPMDFILARRQWATLGYVSFLVGTLANGLIAYLGVLIAKWPM